MRGFQLVRFQQRIFNYSVEKREVPLHIVDGGDSSLDGGDYILFFAKRNDGWLDSTIFVDPTNSCFSWNESLQRHNSVFFYLEQLRFESSLCS